MLTIRPGKAGTGSVSHTVSMFDKDEEMLNK